MHFFRLFCLLIAAAAMPLSAAEPAKTKAKPPNFVFIIAEDMGPEVGCYGDEQARTPHLDRLASEGARFTRAFTHAPVCAPSRSGLITGRYPTSIGSHHMRSKLTRRPVMFTDELQRAGYQVAWPLKTPYGKTDFNFAPGPDWFDRNDDWLENPPREPFFGYINITTTHESQIRSGEKAFKENTSRLSERDRHRPEDMEVPPYHPDAPEVRRDLARYYDLVTAMDRQVGDVLRKLERNGLDKNTVVFFFGDHGRGLPRSKRWVYDSGIHVPLIVRWPGQIEPGTVRNDLVTFIDFAPTLVSIAGGYTPPEWQGQVILGPQTAPPREFVFSARDRMDETDDRIRAVRSARYKYIRNFHPELPYAQRITYAEEMPTLKVWRQWAEEGRLKGPQRLFFAPGKPQEEFYDVVNDPHEIRNLAGSSSHRRELERHRAALDQWILETGDLGEFSEQELVRRGVVENVRAQYESRQVR